MPETDHPQQIASQTRGLESISTRAPTGQAPEAPDAGPAELLPELEYACQVGRVDFNQLVTAAFLRQPTFNQDRTQRQAYEYYFPRLSASFETEHDGIARTYYATNVVAAAVLTNDKDLFLKLPDSLVQDVDAVGLLSRLTLLHIRARQYLDREDYRACLDPVFQVIVYCLSVFDSHANALITTDEEQEEAARRSALMSLLASESGRAEKYLWDLVSRKALLQYFYGMLTGLLLILVATPLLHAAPELFKSGSTTGNRNDVLQWALAGGAVGAFISVLQRITNGRFNLSRSTITLQKRKHVSVLMVLGALRPVVGAVFGVVLFTFQNAGLVPFRPADGVDQSVYFAALGFLVGFSERFARDMVLAAEPGTVGDSRVVQEQQVYPTPGAEIHVDRTSSGAAPR
ncbi:hypothetical protein [Nocardioides marmoribigeumensis]|uniref:Uncharacterized protein n=1 Tax=Nocardioides marmoribigeumensis TaxID=433649 RepID=A0ABU2BTY6_9ACTN|nr:hypothetical protein [Nocardioides marmoribigeumensis]MDR7362092.1 hypothetical protein [Nocardioides marmoribigeumensis]